MADPTLKNNTYFSITPPSLYLHYIFFQIYFIYFENKVSLCCSDHPETYYVNQAGRELRDLPALAFCVFGLKAHTIALGSGFVFQQQKEQKQNQKPPTQPSLFQLKIKD